MKVVCVNNISKSLKGNQKLIDNATGDKNPAFKGYYISPDNVRFDSSRKAAKYAEVKCKNTIISWSMKNKNGWSYETKQHVNKNSPCSLVGDK